MRWDELKVGDYIEGEAEDHFQASSRKDAIRAEWLFYFAGRIEEITQRRIVIDGWWRWLCDPDECSEEDPEETRDVFGIIRHDRMIVHKLGRVGTYSRGDSE